MIVSFCGHSDFCESVDIKKKLLSIFCKHLNGKQIDFYLGGYGAFDLYVAKVCKEYQNINRNVKIYFVTPYMSAEYLKKKNNSLYDGIVVPDNVENYIPKFAIEKRNKWVVEKSDFIIAYVKYSWGGAYKTLNYAKIKNKKYVNLV